MSKIQDNNLEEREKLINFFLKYKNFLTQSQYQVFYLYYFEDLSISEIANIVSTTRSAVFDNLNKTRIKLLKIDKKINPESNK